jgi:hypothetical protein
VPQILYTRTPMVWTTVWFLLILKIPVAYLAWVIWWAVKDPPQPGQCDPARVRRPVDGFDPTGSRARRRLLPRPRHPGPHGTPLRRGPRVALARARRRIRA